MQVALFVADQLLGDRVLLEVLRVHEHVAGVAVEVEVGRGLEVEERLLEAVRRPEPEHHVRAGLQVLELELVDRAPVAGRDVLVVHDHVELAFVDDDHSFSGIGDAHRWCSLGNADSNARARAHLGTVYGKVFRTSFGRRPGRAPRARSRPRPRGPAGRRRASTSRRRTRTGRPRTAPGCPCRRTRTRTFASGANALIRARFGTPRTSFAHRTSRPARSRVPGELLRPRVRAASKTAREPRVRRRRRRRPDHAGTGWRRRPRRRLERPLHGVRPELAPELHRREALDHRELQAVDPERRACAGRGTARRRGSRSARPRCSARRRSGSGSGGTRRTCAASRRPCPRRRATGTCSMSEPITGRKMHTVGNAPTEVM